MQHVDRNAVLYFETLNTAQKMYMDSMRIAPDPLASSAHEGEMHVQLRMELSNWASPQHTLLVHTSPQCVKTFVFLPGVAGCCRRAAGQTQLEQMRSGARRHGLRGSFVQRRQPDASDLERAL